MTLNIAPGGGAGEYCTSSGDEFNQQHIGHGEWTGCTPRSPAGPQAGGILWGRMASTLLCIRPHGG